MPRASFLASDSALDVFYRYAGGGSVEPQVLPDRGGAMIGKPVLAWSEISSAVSTTGQKAGRPTGQRGIYAIWRTGSLVTNPNAIRYLEVK
jgi:hypothetical protein